MGDIAANPEAKLSARRNAIALLARVPKVEVNNAVDKLIDLLKNAPNDNSDGRNLYLLEIVQSLGIIGPPATKALPELAKMNATSDKVVLDAIAAAEAAILSKPPSPPAQTPISGADQISAELKTGIDALLKLVDKDSTSPNFVEAAVKLIDPKNPESIRLGVLIAKRGIKADTPEPLKQKYVDVLTKVFTNAESPADKVFAASELAQLTLNAIPIVLEIAVTDKKLPQAVQDAAKNALADLKANWSAATPATGDAGKPAPGGKPAAGDQSGTTPARASDGIPAPAISPTSKK
ncbi:MAG: hypothetical protein JSS02_27355 [Planctomycetes bacterium]|nr:hypothetical protein [Planctomycetota bacterium]